MSGIVSESDVAGAPAIGPLPRRHQKQIGIGIGRQLQAAHWTAGHGADYLPAMLTSLPPSAPALPFGNLLATAYVLVVTTLSTIAFGWLLVMMIWDDIRDRIRTRGNDAGRHDPTI
jgi:hypothetical protein